MDKKVIDISEGRFRYEYPDIRFYPEKITITTGTGAFASGSFKVCLGENNVRQDERIRGYFTVFDHRMKLDEIIVIGKEKTIHFTYDTSFLEASEVCEGKLTFISTHGEKELPYRVEIVEVSPLSGGEEPSSMEEFIALYKEKTEEGLRIFLGEDFKRLLHGSEELRLYQALLHSEDKALALEEFLYYLKAKERIHLLPEKEEYSFFLKEEAATYKIRLKKNTWGSFKAELFLTGEAYELSKRELTEKDFQNGENEVEISLKPLKFREGSFKESLFLSLPYETLEIPVFFHSQKKRKTTTSLKRKKALLFREAGLLFYRYRMGAAMKEEFIEALREALSFGEPYQREEEDYLSAYIDWLNDEKEKVQSFLLERDKMEKRPLAGALHLYLSFLLREEEGDYPYKMEEVCTDYGVKEAFFFLLYMNPTLRTQPKRRFSLLLRLSDSGEESFFLYSELWLLLNQNPELLKELSPLMEKVFVKALRYAYPMKEELRRKFLYLASGSRRYRPLLLSALVLLYEREKDKAVLEVLLSQLFLSERKDELSQFYFREGIREGITPSGIFERYVEGLKDGEEIEPVTYRYFLYGDKLSFEDKAKLYSFLLEHTEEEEYLEFYEAYLEKIRQLSKIFLNFKRIGRKEVILYRELPEGVEDLRRWAFLAYKHHFMSKKTGAKELMVFHRGLKEAVKYELKKGEAYPDLLEDSICLLADGKGRCFLPEADEKPSALYDGEGYARKVLPLPNPDLLSLSYFFFRRDSLDTESFLKVMSFIEASEEVLENYRREARYLLLLHFDREGKKNEVLRLLDEVDLAAYQKEEGRKLVRLFLKWKPERGLDVVRYYGIGKLPEEEFSLLLEYFSGSGEKDKEAVWMEVSERMICSERVPDEILVLLSDKLEGPANLLLRLMKKLAERRLLSPSFKNRLLEQLIFSEVFPDEEEEELLLLGEEVDKVLIKAYWNLCFYHWLLKDRKLTPFAHRKLSEIAMRKEENLPILSYLKVLKEKEGLSEVEVEFLSMSLSRLSEEGIIFPFFKDFSKTYSILPEIEELDFISYQAEEEDELILRYKLIEEGREEEGEAIELRLKSVFLGFFVKVFLLFPDERLEYSLFRKEGEEEILLKSDIIRKNYEDILSEDEERSLFAGLKQIFLARELEDEKALSSAIERYYLKKEIVKRVFSLSFLEEDEIK